MYSLFKKVINENSLVSEDALTEIITRFSLKKFNKKTLIVKEGSVCRQFFFINKGMIRTFVNHKGNEVTTWVALPGTIETSAQSFLKEIPSEINLEAITDCEVLFMNRADYYFLIENNRSFNAFALQMLENFYLRVEDKFYSYLFLSAEERLKKMQTQFPDHFDQVPLKYLASILRIKPETLSRLRSKNNKGT
jgi:CRP-like cAMP-binding protein